MPRRACVSVTMLPCATYNLRLIAERKRNERRQLPEGMQALITAARQIIETVNMPLTEQVNIERNHAHTCWGSCARLYRKLTAQTLCSYLNRLLGKADFLRIKQLAFPISI